MLRIAVISLFVANLLLFAFKGKEPPVQVKATTRPATVEDSNIPTIHLFNEMVQDQDLMSDNRRCFSLGPFHSNEDMDEIRAQLDEVSANISERQTQALVEKGFWVFLPPHKSLLEANQVLFSLQALGLEDIVVIYQGEWTNAISLGYFLRQENAQKRKKSLEDRGYAPLMRVQRQAESRYWLDYEQAPGSVLIALDLQDRPNDFMRRSLPCPEENPFETVAGVAENLADNTAGTETQNTQDIEGSETAVVLENDAGENVEAPPEANVETVPVAIDDTEIETGGETEAVASENIADGNVQEQRQALEEVDTSLSRGVDSAESADKESVETDDPPPPPLVVTDSENGTEAKSEDAAETEAGSVQEQPALEDEVANTAKNVGTGPQIGFEFKPNSNSDTEPAQDTEAETGNGEVKDPEKDEGANPESNNETEPDGG